MVVLQKMLPDLLQSLLQQWPDEFSDAVSLEIGLSGGLDSMVLLDLMARARMHRVFSLSAVHVHHGLSPNAGRWQQHCEAVCGQLNITLRVAQVVCGSSGMGLEAEARSKRYQVYSETAAQVIVLAHHQDDQAETVLLQLLRGGGVRALAAMPPIRSWQGKYLWRPFLSWSRSMLEAYAAWRGLSWVDDESNTDTYWRRNWLRHEIMPLIAVALPDYRSHLVRSAQLMAEATDILQEIRLHDLTHCQESDQVDLSRFLALSPARQRQLLVCWIEQSGGSVLTPDAIEVFRQQVLYAGHDKNPVLALGDDVVMVRYRQQIGLYRSPATSPSPLSLYWPCPGEIVAPFWPGKLRFVQRAGGIKESLLQPAFSLFPRRGGERLLTSVGHKSVKTLFQEHGVPPILRRQWPLLMTHGGRLIAVPGIAVAEDCQAKQHRGWWPEWCPEKPSIRRQMAAASY